MGIFKNKMNVVVLIFFVAAVLFSIYSIIFNDNNNKGDSINGLNAEQVAIYTTSEYIVSDYNTFYEVEGIVNQIISAMEQNKYSEIYNKISSEVIEDISKEKCIELLKNMYANNFKTITNEDGTSVVYRNVKNLDYLYKIKDNSYIASVKNVKNSSTKIGIEITNNNMWKIIYLEF